MLASSPPIRLCHAGSLNACAFQSGFAGYVGMLAGEMVQLKVGKVLSKRALRKRLEAVVRRPKLALRLAQRYTGFPLYQEAILDLGEIKLEGNLKSRKKQRTRLASGRMKKPDVEYHFKN